MSFYRRRTTVDVEDTLERLRSLSAECSDAGLEEEASSEVEQTSTARRAQDQKVFCCECNLSFGLAEKRLPIEGKGVAHADCHAKFEHRERQRRERFDRFLTRDTIH